MSINIDARRKLDVNTPDSEAWTLRDVLADCLEKIMLDNAP